MYKLNPRLLVLQQQFVCHNLRAEIKIYGKSISNDDRWYFFHKPLSLSSISISSERSLHVI